MTFASLLMGLATAWLFFRLPGGVVAALVLPAIVLAVSRKVLPHRSTWSLWAFLLGALVSSSLAILLGPVAVPAVNFLTVTVTFSVFTAALLLTRSSQRLSNVVLTTMYWVFGLTGLIGIGEIVTGIKLTTFLYPDASMLAIDNRFLVAAFFPNYNDYAVVVTMFAIMSLSRLLLAPRPDVVWRIGHLALYGVAALLIVVQGSRGALLALLAGSVLMAAHAVRLVRPRLIRAPLVLFGVLAITFAGLLVWTSPWLQDHSTSVRENIIGNTFELAPPYSSRFWTGWGDIGVFQGAAAQAFPWTLMDPHNIFLETFTWYGMPTAVLLAVLWFSVFRRGIWRLHVRPGWQNAAAVNLMALTPILGVVPSASLRYYYVFVLAACAMVALTPGGTGPRRDIPPEGEAVSELHSKVSRPIGED